MISLTTRLGALSPYTQATAFAVAGPFKTLQPVVVVGREDKVLLDPKKPFLCRESVNGQSPRTGPSVRVSINGKRRSGVPKVSQPLKLTVTTLFQIVVFVVSYAPVVRWLAHRYLGFKPWT